MATETKILIDTSCWIEFFNKKEKLYSEISNLLQNPISIFITGVILQEILQGFKDELTKNIAYESLLALDFIEPQFPTTYFKAANIYYNGRKKGITIRKPIDCLIAQISIENDLTLYHKDSDFDRIASFTELISKNSY